MRAQRAIDRAERTADPPLTPPFQGGECAFQPPRTTPLRLLVFARKRWFHAKPRSREEVRSNTKTRPKQFTRSPAKAGAHLPSIAPAREKEMDACLRRQAGRDGGFATKEKILPIGN